MPLRAASVSWMLQRRLTGTATAPHAVIARNACWASVKLISLLLEMALHQCKDVLQECRWPGERWNAQGCSHPSP